jgi:queuine/archaeosine tRNA-ribosyltransferase
MISTIHTHYKRSCCFVCENVVQSKYAELYVIHGDVNSSSRIECCHGTYYRDVKIVHFGNLVFLSDYSSPHDFTEVVCMYIYYVNVSKRKEISKILKN